MSKLVFEQTLIEIISLEVELGWMRKFFEELLSDNTWFALLLEEAEDLVDFVRNDISILVLLILGGSLSLSLSLRVVFTIFLHHHLPFSFHLPSTLSFIGNRVSHLEWFAFVSEGGRLTIVRKNNRCVWVGLIAVLEKALNVSLIFSFTHLSILLKIAGGFSYTLLAITADVSSLHPRRKVIRSWYLRLSW